MKHLRLFESFKEQDIRDICKKYDIKNYIINEDGSIDVNGNVSLGYKNLTKLPLKFRNVTGNFLCFDNRLTTLEGCPKLVGRVFACDDNKLTSLEGCPESVGGDFSCKKNKILTFEHLPLSMGGYFFCICNPIYGIWKLFKDYSKIEFLNDCDAIREPDAGSKRPIIISDRFDYFLEEIGKKPVAYVKGYDCI